MSDIMKHEIADGQPEGTFIFLRGENWVTVKTDFTNPQLEKLFELAGEDSNWQTFLQYRGEASRASGVARELIDKDVTVPYAFVLKDKERSLRCLNYLQLFTAAFATAPEEKVATMMYPVNGADFIQVCQALNVQLVELLDAEQWHAELEDDSAESKLLIAVRSQLGV